MFTTLQETLKVQDNNTLFTLNQKQRCQLVNDILNEQGNVSVDFGKEDKCTESNGV